MSVLVCLCVSDEIYLHDSICGHFCTYQSMSSSSSLSIHNLPTPGSKSQLKKQAKRDWLEQQKQQRQHQKQQQQQQQQTATSTKQSRNKRKRQKLDHGNNQNMER